jgi:protein-S-isoprenylcysteine O-methyltransferase Ste14
VLAFVMVMVWWMPVPAGGRGSHPIWVAAGMALGFLGLAVRAWALGYVPLGTSGRGTKELRAETLNTRGLYSVVRHPLYLGNFFLWMGVVVLSGRPMAMVVTILAFWLYYERIMMAEERYLYEQFGTVFGRWASHTPPFVPRLARWEPSDLPFSFRFCLGRDYQALYGFVASTTAVELVRTVSDPAGARWPSSAWAWYFAAGTAAYFLLHTLKRRTDLLEPPDDR